MKNDSKLFSVLALLLIVGAGIAVYFIYFNQAAPQPREDSANQDPPPRTNRPAVKTRDFTPESAGRTDPVVSNKPELPVTLDKTLRRMLISGRVTDEGGRVLSDVRVEFQGTGDLALFRGTGFTDPSGMYSLLAWERTNIRRVSGAQSGGWVYAKAPDGRLATGEVQSFAPSASAAMADIVLKLQSAIEGNVLGADGAPAPFAQVTLRSMGVFRVLDESGGAASYENRPVVRTTGADEKGRFSFTRLVPGSYGLTVEPGYFGSAPIPATVDTSDGATHWQELKLARQNQVRGILKDQDGTPIEGAVVLLQKTGDARLPEAPGITATDEKPTVKPASRRDAVRGRDFRAAKGDWRCITDAEGRFGFADLPNMQFDLHARCGNSAASLTDVRVNTDDYALTLNLECSVAGTVRDATTNQPISNYDIRIYGDSTEPTPFDRVSEDALFPWHGAGRFRIFNAPQGAINLRVSAPGYAPAVLNVKDLAAAERRVGVDFMLRPLCDVTLTLKSGEKLLPREPVFLLFDGRSLAESSTDDFGEVRLPALMAAEYEIRVQRADGSVLSGKISVPGQSSHTASVPMAPK